MLCDDKLTAWEREFIQSVSGQLYETWDLTTPQYSKLTEIWEKYHGRNI